MIPGFFGTREPRIARLGTSSPSRSAANAVPPHPLLILYPLLFRIGSQPFFVLAFNPSKFENNLLPSQRRGPLRCWRVQSVLYPPHPCSSFFSFIYVCTDAYMYIYTCICICIYMHSEPETEFDKAPLRLACAVNAVPPHLPPRRVFGKSIFVLRGVD